MGRNAADVLVETMIEWGVHTVFGIPGDGINGIMEALRTRQDKVRFIQMRHEESAAFAACAYAKYTGKLGCCLATSGPGGIHLLNGLYDAKLDQAPVLAITGQTYSDLIGSNFQQDVNMVQLFSDVAYYNQPVVNPNQVEMLVHEACRHAMNNRTVSHISFPVDYQMKEPDGHTTDHKVRGSQSAEWLRPLSIPPLGDLERAARILNEAERPMILCGQGALGAAGEVTKLAETLGAPVAKALLGKAVLPDDHPYSTGGLGMLGTGPSVEAMEGCDALLLIGTSFPYMEYLPKPGTAKGIQIDDKPDRIGLRYPVEVGLVGDSVHTLRALLPHLKYKEDRSWIVACQKAMGEWWELLSSQESSNETPIKPQRVPFELSELASEDCIVSTDSGTVTAWVARHFRVKARQMFSCSGTLATMAPALPYSIAAQLAFPDRQCIAVIGDGGFTMLMGDFATAVKYELPIVVIVLKNNVLGMIKWEQIVFLGNPEYGVELQPIDFAMFAEACGGTGYSVESPDDLGPVLKRALELRRPCIVEVLVDPFEPPMPPKVTVKQAMHFAEALAKGQPDGGRIALTLFRDKVAELF